MKVESIKRKEEIEEEEQYIKYSVEDIERLIKEDVKKLGYKVGGFRVVTDYRYEGDDWGMNKTLTSYLKRIEAVVVEEIEWGR